MAFCNALQIAKGRPKAFAAAHPEVVRVSKENGDFNIL